MVPKINAHAIIGLKEGRGEVGKMVDDCAWDTCFTGQKHEMRYVNINIDPSERTRHVDYE